jgi:thioredoxin 1
MRTIKQNIIYFFLLPISVIILSGNISCSGGSDKNDKQSGDTTANKVNPQSLDKDSSTKKENPNASDTASVNQKVKQVNATQNTQQNSKVINAVTNQTTTKTTRVSNQVHTEVTILNSQTFDETIKSGVTLVDFWAVWCKPCRMEAPIVEEINTEIAGRAKVCKMDIDQNKTIADRFNIQYIPTLIIFKDGKIMKQFTGFTAKDVLLGALTSQLK